MRRPAAREAAVFSAFAALTVLMTWPWALNWRDAVPDPGDPYLVSWILWWDFHQTFNDPLNLFHGNIFYPYRYTLAFSEHSWGLSLLFFPLYALGARPLTVHSLATLVGFAACGYAMFRLARTLTGSCGVAWIAGIGFAFVPYRFAQMSHLMYLFAAWIPLLLEALVLYARRRTWRRAAWLGAAFLMNALTCIHWFALTLVPLAATAALLLTRRRLWRERAFWTRSLASLAVAALLLVPFLLPYARVAELYGFTRSREAAAHYSAQPTHWLYAMGRSKLWSGFGSRFDDKTGERQLFPGLLLLLLPLACVLLPATQHARKDQDGDTRRVDDDDSRSRGDGSREVDGGDAATGDEARRVDEGSAELSSDAAARGHVALSGSGRAAAPAPGRRRGVVFALDLLALALALNAFYVFGAGRLELKLFGAKLFSASDTSKTLLYLLAVLVARCCLAYPHYLRRAGGAANFAETLRRASPRGEAFWIGVVWAALGFLGSLGMNFGFHRILFESVTLFRSIRVPARWAMIAYVGLALLAGLGAERLAEAFARRRRERRTRMTTRPGLVARLRPAFVARIAPRAAAAVFRPSARSPVYALIAAALLFDLRAAPLDFLQRGAADPDELTLRLKATPMRGGIVTLPAEIDAVKHLAVLRAADHGRPLITAFSGFTTPLAWEIEQASRARPVPARLLDLLEEIPASYVVVYYEHIPKARVLGLEQFLWQAAAAGRLRYVRSYGEGDARQDLYAVTKTEPEAGNETGAAMPPISLPEVPADEVHLGHPSNDPVYVVRQQFYALLGREPSEDEKNAFVHALTACGADFHCRITTRARLTLDLLRTREFREGGFLIFNLYRALTGRAPAYEDYKWALRLRQSVPAADREEFVRRWFNGDELLQFISSKLADDEFVARAHVGLGARERAEIARRLGRGETTREAVLLGAADRLAADAEAFNFAAVAVQYFAHLRRDAEAGGYETWRRVLAEGGDAAYIEMIKGFLGSPEYDDKFGAP